MLSEALPSLNSPPVESSSWSDPGVDGLIDDDDERRAFRTGCMDVRIESAEI